MKTIISLSARQPTPPKVRKAREVLKKHEAEVRQRQKKRARHSVSKIRIMLKQIEAIKKNGRAAVAKLDAKIRKLQDNNQKVILRIKALEDKKASLIERINERIKKLKVKIAKRSGRIKSDQS